MYRITMGLLPPAPRRIIPNGHLGQLPGGLVPDIPEGFGVPSNVPLPPAISSAEWNALHVAGPGGEADLFYTVIYPSGERVVSQVCSVPGGGGVARTASVEEYQLQGGWPTCAEIIAAFEAGGGAPLDGGVAFNGDGGAPADGNGGAPVNGDGAVPPANGFPPPNGGGVPVNGDGPFVIVDGNGGAPGAGLVRDPDTGFLVDPTTGQIHDATTGEATPFAFSPDGIIIDLRTGEPATDEALRELFGEEADVGSKLIAVGGLSAGIVLAALVAAGTI